MRLLELEEVNCTDSIYLTAVQLADILALSCKL